LARPPFNAVAARLDSAFVLRLPEPMLARPGLLPTGGGWLFEPKLDGFRLLTCTHAQRFRARSRKGSNMTNLLPELAATLPANVQLDGEIVALNAEGVPDFHRLGSRLLHGQEQVATRERAPPPVPARGLM
jgi:bifunctional non-homologous end joining protein LigD